MLFADQITAARVAIAGAGLPYWTDPRLLMRSTMSSGLLTDGTNTASTATFWSGYIDKIGDYQTSSPFSATRTIIDVTGRGQLRGCIGPMLGAAGTITWTITVDGIAYSVVQGADNNAYRGILGRIYRETAIYTTAALPGGYGAVSNVEDRADNATSIRLGTGTFLILSPTEISEFIKFNASLKVQVACSVDINADAEAGYSGCIWSLDT